MADKYWKEPLKWNREARDAGERRRVFCSSLADIFDDEAPQDQRDRLWDLIKETTGLDWLLLTKRPENFEKYLPKDWLTHARGSSPYYPNVWLGVTVENQKMADQRIPLLANQTARIKFLSCEPLLERVELVNGQANRWSLPTQKDANGRGIEWTDPGENYLPVDWVIVGGESGPNARAFNMQWARKILADCRAAQVACFVKQMGSRPFDDDGRGPYLDWMQKTGGKRHVDGWPRFDDKKGGDPSEWPEDLYVQEFPVKMVPPPKRLI